MTTLNIYLKISCEGRHLTRKVILRRDKLIAVDCIRVWPTLKHSNYLEDANAHESERSYLWICRQGKQHPVHDFLKIGNHIVASVGIGWGKSFGVASVVRAHCVAFEYQSEEHQRQC